MAPGVWPAIKLAAWTAVLLACGAHKLASRRGEKSAGGSSCPSAALLRPTTSRVHAPAAALACLLWLETVLEASRRWVFAAFLSCFCYAFFLSLVLAVSAGWAITRPQLEAPQARVVSGLPALYFLGSELLLLLELTSPAVRTRSDIALHRKTRRERVHTSHSSTQGGSEEALALAAGFVRAASVVVAWIWVSTSVRDEVDALARAEQRYVVASAFTLEEEEEDAAEAGGRRRAPASASFAAAVAPEHAKAGLLRGFATTVSLYVVAIIFIVVVSILNPFLAPFLEGVGDAALWAFVTSLLVLFRPRPASACAAARRTNPTTP